MALNKTPFEKINLFEYISPRHFRTVSNFEMHHVEKEYGVELFLKDKFRKKLSFKTPWLGQLYGYAFITNKMAELLKKNDIDYHNIKVNLNDWDNRFVLSITDPINMKEIQLSCEQIEVLELLEWCVKIPEQRIKNDVRDK